MQTVFVNSAGHFLWLLCWAGAKALSALYTDRNIIIHTQLVRKITAECRINWNRFFPALSQNLAMKHCRILPVLNIVYKLTEFNSSAYVMENICFIHKVTFTCTFSLSRTYTHIQDLSLLDCTADSMSYKLYSSLNVIT